jgi:GNAT superfamily N-acetyltransferase
LDDSSLERIKHYVADLALSRRLERAEGAASARFIEARRRLFPESGAEWIDVAGTYAMYDGPRSPLTQTFGLGLFAPATGAILDEIESYYRQRIAPVQHEVSPIAGAMPLLVERGYRPVELTSVMYLPLDGRAGVGGLNERIRVRRATGADLDEVVRVAVEGWHDLIDFDDLMPQLMRTGAESEGYSQFLAEFDGQAVAAGSFVVHDGVGLLAGACTVPAARNQGAQRALLDARLRYAAELGCDVAMLCAAPGSASQRNGERLGFRIAYTRTKWGLAASETGESARTS